MMALAKKTPTGSSRGSALILTVVLTSLLAILGVLFLLTMRMDRMATSATSQNRQLDLAVETVVAQIGNVLAEDVPGVSRGAEYYDFPDANDPWLADLEPYESGTEFYWRQISDLSGALGANARDVRIQMVGEREAIRDLVSDPNADADGDGVSDAMWFALPEIMSNRGRPIYAAIRIVDNGGMLNLNTGYWFAPQLGQKSFIDGRTPFHVNVVALGEKGATEQSRANALLQTHRIDPQDPNGYERDVIWRYLRPTPTSVYTPFDLSDELDLRYRFILDRQDVSTRAERWGKGRLTANTSKHTPVDRSNELTDWFPRAHLDLLADEALDSSYDYRHLATTYNMDRVLMPGPVDPCAPLGVRKMVCVNEENEIVIYGAVRTALIEGNPGVPLPILEDEAAQIAANVRDYVDKDNDITVMARPSEPNSPDEFIYGFETPRVYVSEIAYRGVDDPNTGRIHESYAIELYKPYFEDPDPLDSEWELFINNPRNTPDVTISVDWSGSRRFHIVLGEDPRAELFDDTDFLDPNEPSNTSPYGYIASQYANPQAQLDTGLKFEEGAAIELRRTASGGKVVVDYVRVPYNWMERNKGPRSIQRDISSHRCVRRLWADAPSAAVGLGGALNNYVDTDHPDIIIQAHPAGRSLKNIGELGMVFARDGYGVTNDMTAEEVLIDLANPGYARLFNYLTVIDPKSHTGDPLETRVMGRININTAPWLVLAQLPWIRHQAGPNLVSSSARAKAIVNYRQTAGRPFSSIAELMQITELRQMWSDDLDNLYDDIGTDPNGYTWGPDLTYDTARDDLEERDIIFTRMSDLVTVRSDVFTAYILVRIGLDGPQKRVIALLDRSEPDPDGVHPGVRVVAIHSVPDPR